MQRPKAATMPDLGVRVLLHPRAAGIRDILGWRKGAVETLAAFLGHTDVDDEAEMPLQGNVCIQFMYKILCPISIGVSPIY